MNDSDVVTIPIAVATIIVSICVVLLVSLAITCVFFDSTGYRRRIGRRRVTRRYATSNRGTRRTARRVPLNVQTSPRRPRNAPPRPQSTSRREPWGR